MSSVHATAFDKDAEKIVILRSVLTRYIVVPVVAAAAQVWTWPPPDWPEVPKELALCTARVDKLAARMDEHAEGMLDLTAVLEELTGKAHAAADINRGIGQLAKSSLEEEGAEAKMSGEDAAVEDTEGEAKKSGDDTAEDDELSDWKPKRLKFEEWLNSMLDLPGLTGRMLFWRCDERAPGTSAPIPGKAPSWWCWWSFAMEGDEEDADEMEKDWWGLAVEDDEEDAEETEKEDVEEVKFFASV